jgi:hypothetical protein
MGEFDPGAVAGRLRVSDEFVSQRAAHERRQQERDRCCESEDQAVAFDRGCDVGEVFATQFASRQALIEASRIRETGRGIRTSETFREEVADFIREGVDRCRFDTYGWPCTMRYEGWPGGRVFSDRDDRADSFLYGVCHSAAEVFDAVRNLGQ